MNYFPSQQLSQYPLIYRLLYFFLCITALCLPFHKIFASYPLIFAGFTGIVITLTKPDWKNMRSRTIVLVLCGLFASFLYAYFLSENRMEAWNDLRGKFYFLFFPIIFFAIKPFSKSLIHYLLHLFVVACLLFIVTSLGVASYTFITSGVSHFYYKELVGFTSIHPSYLGLYINFSIVITAMHMFSENIFANRKRLIVYILLLILLFIYLVMLTAKTAIFIGGISLIGIFLYWGKDSGQMRKALFYLFAAFLFLTIIAVSDAGMRTRIGMVFNYKDVQYDNSVLSRQYQWQSARQLINDSGWKGVGSGNATDKLVEYYAKNNFQKGVEERYNTHNQYLQSAVEGGWISLSLLFFVFIITIAHAIRHHNYLYLYFTAIFLISILTECMFETLSGIVFFNLFSMILLTGMRGKHT